MPMAYEEFKSGSAAWVGVALGPDAKIEQWPRCRSRSADLRIDEYAKETDLMGAMFKTITLQGTSGHGLVAAEFAECQEVDRYQNGHRYSGGFGMATGLVFAGLEFSGECAARDWLEKNCRKWDVAKAVRYTTGDEAFWMIGAMCSW